MKMRYLTAAAAMLSAAPFPFPYLRDPHLPIWLGVAKRGNRKGRSGWDYRR
jgi:hypothetical protein